MGVRSVPAEQPLFLIGNTGIARERVAELGKDRAQLTVSPRLCEDVTFLTGNALRTASLTWLSHMAHIMPSIFSVI